MSDRVITDLSKNGVLTVTLNRPDKKNAIDREMIDGLLEALNTAQLDSNVNVVSLRGAGEDFCAGADLAELLESAHKSPSENAEDAQRLGNVFLAIHNLPKPVVAVVQGRALAGGCGLATACDMIVASESASFGYPEVKRGFVPAMVMAMLTRAVGSKVAFDLVATGRILTAREALEIGIVSRIVSDAGFEAEAQSVCEDLSASSTSALAFIKRQLKEIEGLSFEDAVALGAKVNAVARTTPDFKVAVARFLNR